MLQVYLWSWIQNSKITTLHLSNWWCKHTFKYHKVNWDPFRQVLSIQYYTAYYILNHQPNKIHNPRINAPLNANVLQFKFMVKNQSWKPQSSMVSGHLGRSVLQDHVHGFNEPATAGEFETDLIKMLLVERLEKGTNGSFFLNMNYFCLNMN